MNNDEEWGSEPLKKLGLRVELECFASAMERVLRRNDHKGGWYKSSPLYLFAKMVEEVGELSELAQIMDMKGLEDAPSEFIDRIVAECADVAVCAMMLADKVSGGGLHRLVLSSPIESRGDLGPPESG